MRKKYLWIGLAGAVALAVAISLVALPSKVEWTTSSPAALHEFELAQEARMKMYHQDAAVHLEKAVEIDPDFVFAKLLLADVVKRDDSERAQQLFDEVQQADISRLRPRERFFIERAQAVIEKRFTDAADLTKSFFEKHPNDPFIVETMAAVEFSNGDSDEAEKLYRHLLEVSPNWVTAYNQLGYITMRQGRFPEAEEYFTSYRFIAPDQANPHDSLAELYTIQGRYEDAETSLENAILIYPEFWASYKHLVQTHIMMRNFVGAREVLDRWSANEGTIERELDNFGCVVEMAELEFDRSWEQILENLETRCFEEAYPVSSQTHAAHRAACQLGDWDLAARLEGSVREQLDKAREKGSDKMFEIALPMLTHMEGVRLALQGDIEGAEVMFREADASLQYWELGPGIYKLNNRLLLVETLFAQGRDVEAHKLLAKVRSVNPALAAEFEEDGLKILGLERG